MRRRADKPPLQAKAANEALALFVEHKLQAQTSLVSRAAAKAIVSELLLLYLVTVNFLVLGHEIKMKQTRPGCKREDILPPFAIRHSPEATAER
jgi:hypothetical protein